MFQLGYGPLMDDAICVWSLDRFGAEGRGVKVCGVRCSSDILSLSSSLSARTRSTMSATDVIVFWWFGYP